jgi:hypothetical protein
LEVLGENLPQCRFVHHKTHMLPVREPGAAAMGSQRLTAELRHGQLQRLRHEARMESKTNINLARKIF